MHCKKCGAKLSDNLSFCTKCGAKLSDSEINKDNQKFNPFSKINKIKEDTFDFSKNITDNIFKEKISSANPGEFFDYSKEFIENTGNTIANVPSSIIGLKKDEILDEEDKQKDYEDTLDYLRKNNSTIIEFPVSDDDSKEKLTNLLSADIVGGGAGLIGAALTVGIIGVSLGTGLIAVGAVALIGGVLAKNYDNVSWVESELFIWDDELVISGKFSLPYNEIKHIGIKNIDSDELVVLTLKDQVIEFRTHNANALKTIIDEKLVEYYK